MPSDRTWRQYLQLVARLGITHLPSVKLPGQPLPSECSQQSAALSSTQPLSAPADRHLGGSLRSSHALQPESVQISAMSNATSEILDVPLTTAAQKSAVLCRIAEVVAKCKRCTELASARTQTVFGVGDTDARVMFIGEAPGADEDRQGEPFVGRAGILLNKIIEASKLKREDLYICNILRCRPPGNRNPRPQEAANCREFLDAQIQVVDPEYIVCWGSVAAQNLLNEKRTIGRLRGVFHQHGQAKVLCTYHPSYLLRNPSAKKDVWEDMKLLMKDLGVASG